MRKFSASGQLAAYLFPYFDILPEGVILELLLPLLELLEESAVRLRARPLQLDPVQSVGQRQLAAARGEGLLAADLRMCRMPAPCTWISMDTAWNLYDAHSHGY